MPLVLSSDEVAAAFADAPERYRQRKTGKIANA
jgi:hypothetical protein